MVTILLALAILIVRLFPDTSAARWLHLHLVELPLYYAGKLQLTHVLFLVIGLASIQALAMTLPMDLAIILAWDMTLYVEAAAAVWAGSVLGRMRSAWWRAKSKLRFTRTSVRRRGTVRARRSRPLRRPDRRPANDEEGPPRRALAA